MVDQTFPSRLWCGGSACQLSRATPMRVLLHKRSPDVSSCVDVSVPCFVTTRLTLAQPMDSTDTPITATRHSWMMKPFPTRAAHLGGVIFVHQRHLARLLANQMITQQCHWSRLLAFHTGCKLCCTKRHRVLVCRAELVRNLVQGSLLANRHVKLQARPTLSAVEWVKLVQSVQAERYSSTRPME